MALDRIVSEVHLDVYNHDTTPATIKTIALDNLTRYVTAYLEQDGTIYNPDPSAIVTLTALRPDKTGAEAVGSVVELIPATEETERIEYDENDNPITVIIPGEPAVYGLEAEITQAMIAVPGIVLFQFKMEVGNEALRTEIFRANNGRALDGEASSWADEYQGYNLDELVEKVDFIGEVIRQVVIGDISLDDAILETHAYIDNRLSVHDNAIYINT